MRNTKCLFLTLLSVLLPFLLLAQDNGNKFNLVWTDPRDLVGATVGYEYFWNRSDVTVHQRLLVVNDYDGNGYKEIVGWDQLDEHFFVIEADGDDSFGLKGYYSFFPFYIDLNDDGIEEAIYLDEESETDSVAIQLFNYDAAQDSFMIDRTLGKFVKPASEYLMEFYVVKNNFDDDPNSEIVVFSYDRWSNPYGGVSTYLVIFELTSNDVATAGIKIEHQETIAQTRFQVPATITSGDLDNDGHRELVMVSMERKRVFIYESLGEDQYQFVYDTGRYGREAQHTFVSLTYIEDLDKDGLEDLWYCGAHGTVYVIPGRGIYDSTFTFENSALIKKFDGMTQVMGGYYGDCDADGKPNMYWWEHTTESIFEMEYQGGDLRDPANYIYTQIYQNNPDDLVWEPFIAMNIGGFLGGTLDLDNDGKRDFVISAGVFGDYPGLYVFESVHSYTTGVKERSPKTQSPAEFTLSSGYPNPARLNTTLEYELRAPSRVTLNVYNVMGQLVRSFENGPRAAGKYRITFDTEELTAGVYFTRLVTDFGQKTVKLLVSK